MNPAPTPLEYIGALCFGLVIGYITYRTLIRTTAKAAITDLTAVIGAIGGGAVTALFEPGTALFAMYAIGLLTGMVVYFLVFGKRNGWRKLAAVMGTTADDDPAGPGDGAGRPLRR